ncbi:MAG: hypothetical protein CMG78_12120 [Marinobacter sp.]|nr:hypothetical protein [Marinobacter sp.]|tara:strand:+ start:2351 stop:2578 length:228 start_codon:yes stop_codon:yes gene_type:complete
MKSLKIAFVALLLVGMFGCSSELVVRSDMFYPSKHEPRKAMPWYASAGGTSHIEKWFAVTGRTDGFKKLGEKGGK